MNTIRGRLIASSVGIITVLAIMLSLLAYNLVKNAFLSEVDAELRGQAQQTSRIVEPSMGRVFEFGAIPDQGFGSDQRGERRADDVDLPRRLGRRELLAQVVDKDGNVVMSNVEGSRVSKLPGTTEVAPGTGGWRARTVHLDSGVSYRLFEYASTNYVIRTARETTEFESFLDRLATILAAGTLLAAASALMLSRWSAGALLTPIRRMTTTAQTIQETGDLSRRVEHAFQDAEFTELSDSLNDMLASLESSRNAQRSFSADASHELKTPLTSLRGNARFVASIEHEDLEVRSAAQAIVRDIERVVDLADALTTLAWLDAEPPPQLETVDVDALAADEVARARTTYPDHHFVVEGSSGAAISDHALLTRIISNLLSNAGKYSPAGSHVTLTLSQSGTKRRLRVADDGPGIAESERDRIFDRFHRGSNAAGLQGTGLGLAIVSAAAERLGGGVELEKPTSESCGFAVNVEITSGLSENSQDAHRESDIETSKQH